MTCLLSRSIGAFCITGAVVAAAATAAVTASPPLAAQEPATPIEVATRGPRFLSGVGRSAMPINPAGVSVLRRRVTLPTGKMTLDEVLRLIARQTGTRLQYSRDVVPLDVHLQLGGGRISLAAALTEVLLEAKVDIAVVGADELVLVKQQGASLRSQSGAIVGRITDARTGQGVPAVDILLERTHWRTTSDTTGRYRLAEVDSGDYLLIARRLGYAKQSRRVTVRAEREDTVNVALGPAAARLDELVTTATGRRRRIDVANDITTINADSVMQTAPIRSVTDLLEGRVPGLTVQRTSGAPGDPSRLRLRGVSSPLRSNDPVVVVDGIRIYAEQSAKRSGNLAGLPFTSRGLDTMGAGNDAPSPYAAPSPLDYIDPNSIETIEVLKGPSAATLYGQDAANGVIVITTKKGKGGPTRWTANVERGQTRIAGEFPNLLFRWGHVAQQNTPVLCRTGNTARSQDGVSHNSVFYTCVADSVVRFQLLNDPALTVLDRGHRTSLSLGASGGSQSLTYAMTGSYAEEVGLPKLPEYEVARFQTNVGMSPPDWMRRPQHLTQWSVVSSIGARLSATADLSLTTNLSRTAQQRSSLEQQLGTLMTTYLDPASGLYYTSFGNFLSSGTSVTSGFLSSYYQRATDVATNFTNGLSFNWVPLHRFTLTAGAGLNVIQRTDEIFFPRGANPSDTSSAGALSAAQGTSLVSTANVRGHMIRSIGRGFQFQFAMGADYTGTSTADQAFSTLDLPPGTSSQGTRLTGAGRTGRADATFGWYLEPSIGNSRFNFTSGLRLDGGSSYGGSSNGFSLPKFPKLGVSYLVSDESWFPLKDLFQSLRVRVAYGRASRQPGITDRLRLYGGVQPIFTDGNTANGVLLQTVGNTEIRPERNTEIEGGFDADLFDSRLNLSVNGYRKTTDDALLSVPLAPSVYGQNRSTVKNIGVTRNTGLEFTLAAQLLRSGLVSWGTNLSVSRDRNIVVELGRGVLPFYTAGGGVSCGFRTCGGIRVAAGYPLFGRWSAPILGYADGNGNGLLESQEILVGDTAVYVGQTVPNYTANLSTTVSLWRGMVTVNAGFAYVDGLAQNNEVARNLTLFSRAWNDSTASLAEQAATAFDIPTDYNWIQVVNTVRFNDLAVTYRVPTGITRRLGAQQLNVSVQGGNLGLWTNYRGLDPNVNARATGNSVTDTGVLPQPRTWQIRVNATY